MATGFMRGKALCAAVRLGIPDALSGEMTVAEIAAATHSEPVALARLLRALASLGAVRQADAECFVLTELGELLRRDARDSVWASVIFWADLLADSWTYLADCVRTGDRQGAVEAMAREGVTSRWSRESAPERIFAGVFAEGTAQDNMAYACSWDLGHAEVVADLGGAGGGLLAAVLIANPHLRGMLVDRQQALETAAARFAEAGLTGRIELLAADLTEEVPAGADVYVMRSVLHGYGDDTALAILDNCRAALGPGGRLLIVEVVLPDRVRGPDPALESMFMADLNMLAVTGGQERTQAQWQDLLDRAGFALREIRPIEASSHHSTVEAHHSTIEAAPRA